MSLNTLPNKTCSRQAVPSLAIAQYALLFLEVAANLHIPLCVTEVAEDRVFTLFCTSGSRSTTRTEKWTQALQAADLTIAR